MGIFNKNKRLFCQGVWPFLVFPLLLAIVAMLFCWSAIERKIAHGVNAALVDAQPWAQATSYQLGREVLITGLAPSEDHQRQAVALARQTPGVSNAHFVGSIAPPNEGFADEQFVIALDDRQATLSGVIPHLADLAALREQLQQLLPGMEVDTTAVRTLSDVPELPNLFGVVSALAQSTEAGSAEKAKLKIWGNRLRVEAELASPEAKQQLLKEIEDQFDGTVEDAFAVVETYCENAFAEALASSKIEFASGQARISAASEPLLQELATIGRRCKNQRFAVTGHTDSIGGDTDNVSLSQRRAEAVINKLAELGLEATRFEARGMGARQPIADNASADGRRQNRRIEFLLLRKPMTDT